MRKIIFCVVAAGLVYPAMAGCGQRTGVIPKSAVEKEISGKYAEQAGRPARAVSCPKDVTAKVGTSVQCTLTTSDGATHPVIVSVTSVSGRTVNFFIQLGDIGSGSPTPRPS